ncbi:hypothetical protein FQA47_021354 [Oryzias melastigma]|uniref:Secreted protein n=1 Tax=Oryzias melastigma TaxID=30732 RepID=A0A834FJS4_ORYME|nr:hypothetical protein FQA47_021354 [Oryzias melastigma]
MTSFLLWSTVAFRLTSFSAAALARISTGHLALPVSAASKYQTLTYSDVPTPPTHSTPSIPKPLRIKHSSERKKLAAPPLPPFLSTPPWHKRALTRTSAAARHPLHAQSARPSP